MDPTSAVAKGGKGGRTPYRPLLPPFWLTKNTAFETSRNDKTTDSQTMTEKGIITFKHNSPLMFFRFFATLLAANCCTLFWLYGCVAELRKRHVSMQNCYRYFVSDHDMKQCVKTFFKDQLFWFLEHTQHSEVTVSDATRVTGLKPHLQSHLENLISKYQRLNVF